MKLLLTILITISIIFVPFTIPINNNSEILIKEKRKLSVFPKFPNLTKPKEINKFSEGLVHWFEDRMPCRSFGIFLAQKIKWYTNDVPDLDKCILGKENWLFLGNNYDNTISYLTGIKTRTQKDIEQQVHFFKKIKKNVEKHGAKFFILIGPNKSTIYPEFLPKIIVKAPRITPHICELARGEGISVFDPTESLIANKGKGLLYYRTDTHWNQLGTFLALQSFFEWAGLQIDFTPFILKPSSRYKGDLIDIGGFEDFPLTEGDNYIPQLRNDIYFTKINKNILVIGDSFSINTMFYLDHIFKRVHRIHYNELFKTKDLVNLEEYINSLSWNPDMVLWIQVERVYITYGGNS